LMALDQDAKGDAIVVSDNPLDQRLVGLDTSLGSHGLLADAAQLELVKPEASRSGR
jgi:hypothetical protein